MEGSGRRAGQGVPLQGPLATYCRPGGANGRSRLEPPVSGDQVDTPVGRAPLEVRGQRPVQGGTEAQKGRREGGQGLEEEKGGAVGAEALRGM